jgi:hypothetical protein
MGGPRAPHGRGAAVLRLDGSHPGKVTRQRTPTPPVQHREEIKEGEEVKRIGAALTSGPRCRRGRLGVDGGAA